MPKVNWHGIIKSFRGERAFDKIDQILSVLVLRQGWSRCALCESTILTRGKVYQRLLRGACRPDCKDQQQGLPHLYHLARRSLVGFIRKHYEVKVGENLIIAPDWEHTHQTDHILKTSRVKCLVKIDAVQELKLV